MKKYIALSVVTFGLMSSVNVYADADDISSMFSDGKVSGQIREFSISRSVDDSRLSKQDYTRKANAIGGYLKFETANYNGFSLGSAFYTTNGFLNDSPKDDYTQVDPTLLGKDNDSYSLLGEAYLQYKLDNTTLKIGRQKLATPLAGGDDARMLPNLFEAYLLTNTDISNTTLILAHVNKFAQGTFGRAYGAGGILGVTSGYSAVDASNRVGEFVNMGEYAVGTKTDGVTVVGASYKNGAFKAQVWDYYAHDILNAIYADANFSWTCLLNDNIKPFASAQIISQNDVGDKLLKNLGGTGEINSFYYGLKLGAKLENLTAYLAYSKTDENSATDTSYANAIISPWGGMPAYTQGMVTRHIFLAGTEAKKIALSYNFKDMGADVKVVAYHATYEMADNNGYTQADAKESGFDIIYNTDFIKNLQLRFRGNFADDFYVKTTDVDVTKNGSVSWDEYRFIANYSF